MYKTQDNNFNLIRFALATLVIYSHSTPLIHGNNDLEYLKSTFGSFTFGTLAVNLFFAISGYMILKSWMSKPDLKRFCRARILRIYPGFFFVTMFSVFFLNSVGSTFSSNFERIDKLVLLKCLVLLRDFPASADFMPNFPVPALNGSLWTIIYEFKFYMLIALAGSLDVAKRLKFWMAIFLGSILIYSFELFTFLDESRLFLFVIGSSKDTSRLLMFFSSGCAFYILRDRIKPSWTSSLGFLPVIFVGMFQTKIDEIVLASLGVYCLFWLGYKEISFLKRFQKLPDISYGVYLYGWPCQKLILHFYPITNSNDLFIQSFCLTLCFAYLSWRLIESKFLKLKSI